MERLVNAVLRPFGIDEVPVKVSERSGDLLGSATLSGTVKLTHDRNPKAGKAMAAHELVDTALHEARHIVQIGGLAVAAATLPVIGDMFPALRRSIIPHSQLAAWQPAELGRIAIGYIANAIAADRSHNYEALWIERDSRQFSERIMRAINWPPPLSPKQEMFANTQIVIAPPKRVVRY